MVGAGAAVGGLSAILDGCAIAQHYDVIIKGGRVIDGTGAPPVAADIAIVETGSYKSDRSGVPATTTIDASGKIVCLDSSTYIRTPICRCWSIRGPKAKSGRE